MLNLKKEPFSNSPDPELFFQSRQHIGCLQKLEISLRLRRGLNVVIGDVGTGKTTLCRQLVRRLAGDRNMEIHLILDPFFRSPSESLAAVAELFGNIQCSESSGDSADRHTREAIKQFLFRKGIEENKIVVLLIDEGQKIPDFFMEILREFLNYETNEHKLLQIVIFAQKEFRETLAVHANFADRISLYEVLAPLNFRDMKEMIRFRLKQAGAEEGAQALFTCPALWEIYRVTKGYPRKIINLCHQSLLMMIIQNRSGIRWSLIRVCAGRGLYGTDSRKNISRQTKNLLIFFSGICACLLLMGPGQHRSVTNIGKILQWSGLYAKEDKEPAAQHSPEDSLNLQKKIKNFPEKLGQITVNPGETMGELIRMVYGTASSRILETVMAKNPHIGNPHRISAGTQIVFPFIVPSEKRIPLRGYFVEICLYSDFESAMDRMRSLAKEKEEPVRLIPWWSPREKLKFSIVLDECFPDNPSARERLNRMPADSDAKIRSPDTWDRDAVFGISFSEADNRNLKPVCQKFSTP